jgi:hypothetical protein
MQGTWTAFVTRLDAHGAQKVKDKEVALCNVKVSRMRLPFRTFGQGEI